MRRLYIFSISVILLIIGAVILFLHFSKKKDEVNLISNIIKNMKISSPAFDNGVLIPSKYTCDGQNINPPLVIEEVPSEAKSLVLVVDDPDAPMGTWVHWTIWNIDPGTREIPENTVPKGAVEGKTSFGKPGYGGPCPPSGTHRYFFKIYALDVPSLNLNSSATVKDLVKSMQDHILDSGEFFGTYSRQK